MKYIEITEDLFNMHDSHILVHCVSADFALGKGIAVEFDRRFGTKRRLQIDWPDYVNEFHRDKIEGDCIWTSHVFNLVTKERYFHKPTYQSMEAALRVMCDMACYHGVKRIAMPLIGCGLDGLKWERVSEIIKDVFKDTDIEIVVCRKE